MLNDMAAQIGSFSYRYRWLMLVVWLVVILGGGAAMGPVLSSATSARPVQGMEADEARSVLSNESDHGLQLIALVDKVDPTARSTAAAIERATADVSAMPGVRSAAMLGTAPDGKGVAIEVTLVKMTNHNTASKALGGVETRMRTLATQVPGSTVQFGGADVLAQQTNNASQSDLSRAELISLPISLIVMIFIFGGLAAASLPVLGGITTF
jgi:RND superfamily putative drug exporter